MPEDSRPTTPGPTDTARLAELEATVARRPADGEAWGRLGLAYANAGAFDLALSAYENAVRFSPGAAAFWHGLGRARMEKDDLAGALSAALRAVELVPERSTSRLLLARVLGRIGMSRQAILHLEAAVRADPRWALPYADLGHARLAFEEFGQAREAFRMALFLDPERADLWHPLAYCDLRLELWQEAAGALEKLVSLRPEDAIAWARLGAAYRYLGRVDAGARALAKGLELGCDEPWVWFEAGLAAVALGDRPAVEKAQHVLEERDADLARRFEARVVELGRSVGPTDACPAPASTEPARKEEAPSC